MSTQPGPRRRRDAAAARAAEILGNDDRVAPHSLRHQYKMEAAVQLGQPPFPHTLHLAATIATAGLWGLLVYWPAWLFSKQRRYQRARRRALQAQGLL